MKEKALQILKDNIVYYYGIKYNKIWTRSEEETAYCELTAVYETLRDLGLVTKEEYRTMKTEIHDSMRKTA